MAPTDDRKFNTRGILPVRSTETGTYSSPVRNEQQRDEAPRTTSAAQLTTQAGSDGEHQTINEQSTAPSSTYHQTLMARIDAKLPGELSRLLEASGESGLFRGKSDTARTAVRAYFERNPDVAVAAVRALATNEENGVQLTLGDAVRLTGQPPAEFSEELQAVLRPNAPDDSDGDANGA